MRAALRTSEPGVNAIEALTPIEVCLATRFYHPTYSGPSVRFRRYAPGLDQRGVGMRVFVGPVEDPPGDLGPSERRGRNTSGWPGQPRREEVDGVTVDRLAVSPRWPTALRHAAYLEALLRDCRGPARPDVIQFLNLETTAIPWLLAIRRLGVPMVYTQTMVRKLSSDRWKRAYQNLQWRSRLQLMDRVVVSSGVMADELREAGISTPIVVIPNGVDLERFSPPHGPGERDAIRRDLGLPIDGELIVYVGSISPRKALDLLVEAWARFAADRPRAHLVLVGPRHHEIRSTGGDFDYQTRIEAAIGASGAAERVIFTGPVTCVERYLQAADLFVFPSLREGMPNVVPEAFACGVASVLTPFIGLPAEFGSPGEQYLLVERDPEALSDMIVGLLDRPAQRRRLGERARQWAATRLGLSSSLDCYALLYRQLVGARAVGRRMHARPTSDLTLPASS